MGGAAVGSLHYQALFAAGLILMLVLFAFNSFFFFIRKHIDEGIKW
jgi:phosphate transport system permease protein